jgi:sphingolipid C9-methyltransferase
VTLGIFLLQWTGLRRGLRPEDLIWGLFMNKYIFPGADASLCPSAMLKAMEKAGWETHSVENISIHYGWTIKHWHDNWISNREAVVATYGERWYRIWNFFLAWSTLIAEQGNAACFQVVLNKNLDHYNRKRWVTDRAAVLGEREALSSEASVKAAE